MNARIILVGFLVLVVSATFAVLADNNGWVSLFNGKDLTGWRQINGMAKYHVEDGTIVGTTAPGPNSFLCTEKNYGDFELKFDVMVDPRLNSGVQIRSNSTPEYKNGRVHGYQVEIATPCHPGYSGGDAGAIWDEARHTKWIGAPKSTPEAAAAFKPNQWNGFRVICRGDSIRTWVNGVSVADIKDDMTVRGFIGLQVHAFRHDPPAEVRWRNIRIRELP